VALALTDDEISMFKTSGNCLPSCMSTGHQSDLCATVSITVNGTDLIVESNSIPDHDILKDYLYRDIWRGFCMTIAGQSFGMTVPKYPEKNSEASCVPSVAGIALNGVEIWNAYTPDNLAGSLPEYAEMLYGVPDGIDAGQGFMGEPMDICSGHPGPSDTSYHYHKLPPLGRSWDAICFTNVTPGVPSSIFGVAVDGFPIYGPFDENGIELTPSDLDECNGMTVNGSYRYIMTQDFPYGPGCLWGTKADTIQDALCWKASEWEYIMNITNQTLYSDCWSDWTSSSTGTSGCMSFFQNPGLYLSVGKGSLLAFNSEYSFSCGYPDSEYENAGTTTESTTATESTSATESTTATESTSSTESTTATESTSSTASFTSVPLTFLMKLIGLI